MTKDTFCGIISLQDTRGGILLIQLDLSTFKPATLLSRWWRVLAGILGNLQEAHNALDTRLGEETAARISDKNELNASIASERAARTEADNGLSARITSEALSRQNADNSLSANITERAAQLESQIASRASELDVKIQAESAARKNADNSLSGRIDALGALSHTHKNFELIEGISAEDVQRWKQSADEKLENTERMDYFDEMCRDFSDKLKAVYAAMGVAVYDGGIDGQISDEAGIDGGEFGEEYTTTVDFGGGRACPRVLG